MPLKTNEDNKIIIFKKLLYKFNIHTRFYLPVRKALLITRFIMTKCLIYLLKEWVIPSGNKTHLLFKFSNISLNRNLFVPISLVSSIFLILLIGNKIFVILLSALSTVNFRICPAFKFLNELLFFKLFSRSDASVSETLFSLNIEFRLSFCETLYSTYSSFGWTSFRKWFIVFWKC